MVKIKLLTETNFENYIDEIITLFRLQFTAPISRDILKWRYLENPQHEVNAIIALDKNKLVGFIGTIPSYIYYDLEQVKAAIYMNMMTHPEFSGRGIFSKMLRELEIILKSKGYKFLYCFPNYQSNHIMIEKHGWKDIYEIPRLELLNRTSRRMEKTESELISIDREYVCQTDDLNKKMLGKRIVHSSKFREWRIKNNPAAIYDNYIISNDTEGVLGYITVRRYKLEYNIVDIGFKKINYAKMLICHVIEQFEILGLSNLTAWCPINSDLHIVYERLGFRNNYPITYFAGKVIDNACDVLQLTDWNGWFVQAIDDNIY